MQPSSERCIVALAATVRNNRHTLSDGEAEQIASAGRQIEQLELRLAAQREAAAAAASLLQKQPWETEISTLISALNILAQDIQSDDGVANSAIAEGAARLGVRIVGNRMLDRHGKRLATLSNDEAAELRPQQVVAPAGNSFYEITDDRPAGEPNSALYSLTRTDHGRRAAASVMLGDPHGDEKINLLAIVEGHRRLGINANVDHMRGPELAATGWSPHKPFRAVQPDRKAVFDDELDAFIKSESADLGKRRVTLRALQALRQQKQAEADKTDLEDLIEAERADLRERFARMQDAQAAARAKKPFVIPPLTTPAQPTTTRALEQKAAPMSIGEYGNPKARTESVDANHRPVDKPFDSKAWNKARADRIKASKADGNRHLDQLNPSVEGMRGLNIYNVHDPKERGKVRTVSNRGDVVVHWVDQYSANKNSADPIEEKNKAWLKNFGGQKNTFESWLSPSDLVDYVVYEGKEAQSSSNGKPPTTTRVIEQKAVQMPVPNTAAKPAPAASVKGRRTRRQPCRRAVAVERLGRFPRLTAWTPGQASRALTSSKCHRIPRRMSRTDTERNRCETGKKRPGACCNKLATSGLRLA